MHTSKSQNAKIGMKYRDSRWSCLIFVAKMEMRNMFPIIPVISTVDKIMSTGNNALAMPLQYSCNKYVWLSSISTLKLYLKFIQVANGLLLKQRQLYNSQSIVRERPVNDVYIENEANIVNMEST